MHTFIATLGTRARRWKQQDIVDSQVGKQKVYIHTVEYYSAIKKNEILMHATTMDETQRPCSVREARHIGHRVVIPYVDCPRYSSL